MPNTDARRHDRPSFVETADGRRLAYSEFGDAAGHPVVYCHGFPSSRREALLLQASASDAGARIISADRPGYGDSDHQPGRCIADWSEDVALLADRLGLERFAVLGLQQTLELLGGDPKAGDMKPVPSPGDAEKAIELDATAFFQVADDLYMHERYRIDSDSAGH